MHGTHVCREAAHAGRLFVPERRYASQPRRGQVARQRPVDQGQGESDEVLQLQKAAGNRAVSETIGARQAEPPAQRLLDAGGATVQRASFAELMAFWKKQELGQDPAKEEAKGEESPNVPPDPESLPEEVKAMNPAVEEEAGEQQQQPRGPVAYQVDGGGEEKSGGGLRGPVAYQVDGGGEEKSGGGPRGPVAYQVYGGGGGGSATDTLSESGGEEPNGGEEKAGGLRGPVAYQVDGGGATETVSGSESVDGGGQVEAKGPVAYKVYGGGGGGGGYGTYRPEPSNGSLSLSDDESEAPAQEQRQSPVPEQKKGPTVYARGPMDIPSGELSESDQDTAEDEPELPGMEEPQDQVANGPQQHRVQLGPNQVAGNKIKVKYLETGEARKEFQLNVGGSITQGGEPFDTSKMYSKFMGDGFGIYVMGKDGTFYATSHKIGLFHHSSFLGGGDVAGAGEMKVVGGTLQFITNKSGHYWPGDQELAQTLNELQGASGFAAAGLAQLMPNGGLRNPYPGGPAQFLQDHPVGVLNNKDGTKYGGKAMVMDKSEKENSIATVRAILASYVKQAQLGKLKKFNKPNPNFGNTLEDIKQLVLAEFGWNEQDVADYEEVLKNWNNDKEIVDVREAPPPPIPLSNSLSSDESSPTSQSVDAGEQSASGRDWDAELEEALQDNPSPDWQGLGVEPYGSGLIIWNEEHTSFRTATAKQKVQLLKGEVTIDELR